MDFKKLTLDFYRAVRRLPNFGKVMAAASVASLYLAINPAVHEILDVAYNFNTFCQKPDGTLGFRLYPSVSDKYPNEYINSSKELEAGDNIVVMREFNNPKGEVFLLYNVTNRMQYKEWIVALNKYLKNRQRKKMTLSFLFCAGICFSSDPDLIRRLRALIPKKL